MGQKLLPKNRSILFVSLCFGLFCEASSVPAAPGEAAVAQRGQGGGSPQEHLAWNHGWELCAAQAG